MMGLINAHSPLPAFGTRILQILSSYRLLQGLFSRRYEPQKSRGQNWTTAAQEQYNAILEQANEVVYVGQEYTSACMLKRNHYLVDHASILLAVYNGVQRSGTGATVNYARKLGREIIVIDPLTCAVTHREGGA